MTTYTITTLEAVNRILRSGQIVPVASLTPPLDRFTTAASAILEEELVKVLNLGWDFNTDYDYQLNADGFGAIAVPADQLSVDIEEYNSNGKHITVRNGALYNNTNNTAVFTESYIKATIVRYITFDNCPLEIQEYIIACAMVEFTSVVTVDAPTTRALEDNKYERWQALKRSDTIQSGLNILNRYPIAQIARTWPIVGADSIMPW